MNRLKEYFNELPESTPPKDYWVVSGDCGFYYVSERTALAICGVLDEPVLPRWITFRDISGARIRVKSAQIDAIYEATESQRAAEREFQRERRREEKADRRPWEDDD